jgi:hypothetical protein
MEQSLEIEGPMVEGTVSDGTCNSLRIVITEERMFDLVKEEYKELNAILDRYNSQIMTIKQWSITLAISLIGAAVWTDKEGLLFVALGIAFLFWVTEGIFRAINRVHIVRQIEIEGYFSYCVTGRIPNCGLVFGFPVDLTHVVPAQIGASWAKKMHGGGSKRRLFLSSFFSQYSWSPHLIIIVICLLVGLAHFGGQYGVAPHSPKDFNTKEGSAQIP